MSVEENNMIGKEMRRKKRLILSDVVVIVLLVITLAAGAYLRLVGVNWDENQHMHPDERFLSLVQVAIAPAEPGTYFDSAISTLNPANRGYTFFVYGTLPIFIVRYLGDALGQTDYHAITLLGRQVSAIFDLMTVLLVFAIGSRLYNRWAGLLGAAFYAFAVLPIQLSHFMTVDTATNTFAFLAVLAAVWALTRTKKTDAPPTETESEPDAAAEEDSLGGSSSPDEGDVLDVSALLKGIGRVLADLGPYLVFGLALGMATASKINAIVLAMILPIVEVIRINQADPDQRQTLILKAIRNLIAAGLLSFIVFRLGQPYAFDGPGFFGFKINETWWANMQSLRAQASGDVDFPPALQWARRSIFFSGKNLVLWGLGLPLGITAWAAYLGMGWMILKKKNWQRHLPLWVFTGLYFAWQSISWVRSMRYQILIYPALALFGGWGLVRLWQTRHAFRIWFLKLRPRFIRFLGVVLTVIVVLTTAGWAFAFTRIYTRDHTRVAASRWIYQNIPGALTLEIDTGEGIFHQPLPYRGGDTFDTFAPFSMPFYGISEGTLNQIQFPHILDELNAASYETLLLSVYAADDPETILGSAMVSDTFLPPEGNWLGAPFDFVFDATVPMSEGVLYYLRLEILEGDTTLKLSGSPLLTITTQDGMVLTQPLHRIQQGVREGFSYLMNIQIPESGIIEEVHVPYLVDQMGAPGMKDLTLSIKLPDESIAAVKSSSGDLTSDFAPGEDIRGESYRFQLDPPLLVEANTVVLINLSTSTPGVRLVPHGPAPVHESGWDDAIPYPVDGFSPYSENGGIYRGDLNFEMYWQDNDLKLEKFETNLDQGDYIFITSNRQWGTTTRVPERYLLTSHYYRQLLGCPEDKDIYWCYSVATPGMFEGKLGFELIETFDSNPDLGPIEFNTQFAEEAFTVYDHPKVLIFKKTDAYDPIAVRQSLRSVDLSKVVYFTPGEAKNYKGPQSGQLDDPRANLMLSEDRLEEQRAGGTWSELFDRDGFPNTSQVLTVVVFYVFVALLGFVVSPLLRLAMPGLADKGYPLSRLAGMLLLALSVWLLGSFGIPFSRMTILLVLLGMVLLSALLFYLQRKTILPDLKKNWRYYLMIEVLALVAFAAFLLIRLGNPDLWHPYKGGEKPMDFSYLNAVLKSTTFPPYDPWFAGGYINYYYYGFVIVGVPIKLLGIVPSVAYNIVLPIWYSVLILASFSVGWNLYKGIPRSKALSLRENRSDAVLGMAFWVGLATAVGLAVLGNLGTIRLIASGYQRLASGGAPIDEAGLGQQISWTIQGFGQFLKGTPMPFYPGDWYWFPSRVIPGEAITEFPFFTFIYGDLHAHLIAFPITVLAISWSLSVILSKGRWGDSTGRFRWLGTILGFLLGAVIIGALRPTNTWDFYTYLVLASLALFYTILRYIEPPENFPGSRLVKKLGIAISAILLLVGLATILYQPFSYWFGQGYNSVALWKGDRTPLNSYLTHWGLFLFVIVSWLVWDTYHWMKTTPQSALKKVSPYLNWIIAGLILFLITLAIFLVLGIGVALVVVPVGLWVIVLMFKPGISNGKRFLLFLIGTAVFLTLAVEILYLPGDIGRMNIVFKFYLQAWIMMALSAGVCLGWLIQSMPYWGRRLAFVWQAIFFMLVTSAALFTLLGTADKIRDRMAPDAPHTLDGMTYMAYATYFDMGLDMQLVEDYNAIRWMQDHVEGSPVILEGQAYEYRWGNRFTIYTGLPNVVGWNWHQRQQRAILRSNIVQERVDEVGLFYTSVDPEFARAYLEKYDVRYIVVGQLERVFFPGAGLEKFEAFEGELWQAVYEEGSTVIYEVIDE